MAAQGEGGLDVFGAPELVVGGLGWQWRGEQPLFTVVAKATFALGEGTLALAHELEPLHARDRHHDDQPWSSVYAPEDMVPLKACADVTLVGEAWAPRPEGARSVIARLVVGTIDKALEVHCDRWLGPDGSVTEGEPFRTMQLRYEHAAGGRGTENPVGVGPGAPGGAGRALPNLVPVGSVAGVHDADVPTVGFGPIAVGWPARRRMLAQAGSAPWHRGAIPREIDRSCFNHAPPDQRLADLPDDACFVLENMHRQCPRLVCRLPGVRPRAYVEQGGAARALPMAADTLWIDTTRAICTVTWRATVSVESPACRGRVLVALERGDARLTWPDVMERALGVTPLQPAPRSARGRTPHEPRTVELPARGATVTHLPLPAPRRETSPWARASAPPVATHVPAHVRGWASASTAAALAEPTACEPPRPPLVALPPIDAPPRPEPRKPPRPLATEPAREIRELLWLDPRAAAGLRREPRWAAALDAPRAPGLERTIRSAFGADGGDDEARGRRDVGTVLGAVEPTPLASLAKELASESRRPHEAPLVVLMGTLRFPFDETEILRAMVATVAPLAPSGSEVHAAAEAARAVIADPLLQGCSFVAGTLAEALRRAASRPLDARTPPLPALDERLERMLLERRAYQTRTVLGAPRIRALLADAEGAVALPCYLPRAVATALPLAASLVVRVLGELYARQDASEACTVAVKVTALERIVRIHTGG
jgi:hypothetical protein